MAIQSAGLESEKKFYEEAEKLQLDREMAEKLFFIQERFRKAYEQREKPWEYLDGLTYTQDYYLNRQAANSYLRPKKNDSEVRIVTGTTEKKIEVVQNELLSLSLSPEIRAFDQDDVLIADLGEQMGDVVERTNEIEKDDDLYSDAVLELLTQRAVFVEERWVIETHRDKINGTETQRRTEKPKKFLVSGLKIFLGDITIPAYRFNEQPYIVKYDRVHWKIAEAMFKYKDDGTVNPMWRHVSKGQSNENGVFGLRIGSLQDDEVEIVTYMSYNDDEYMRTCQSVPMDDIGEKLPWEYEGYNITMKVLKSMSRDFAYGKPLTASAKTLQSLNNETIRLLIQKFRQAIKPPLGVKVGKIFSKDIWAAGAVTQGVKAGDFERLTEHTGITTSEFQFSDFIDSKAEEFIGAGDQQQALTAPGAKKTATEIQTLQKNFAVQLGNAVAALIALKRDMTQLRLFNVMEHVVVPTGKDVDPVTKKIRNIFMQFTKEDTDLGRGRRGEKQIIFTDQEKLTSLKEQEVFMEKFETPREKQGKDIRYFFINVEKLKELAINWFVTVTSKPKDSESLDKAMFTESLTQAVAVSAISKRPLNGDAIIQDYELTWKRKDWFQEEAPLSILPEEGGEPGKGGIGKDLVPAAPPKPSVNTIEGLAA